jgi:hypothetical protein
MRVVIDRFEGDFAVCEKNEREMINIEKSKIPPAAKEGDILIIEQDNISIDKQATWNKKTEVDKLMSDLWE